MTFPMIFTLIVLTTALALFISGRVRMDLVALMVLTSLAAARVISPAEALSGFSSTAVVTVWAVFILSGGLTRTGVASILGRQVLRLAGGDETRLLFVLLFSATLLSGVMNSIGVIAMFLPVVMDIARQTKRSPSKILMPLTQAILLGSTLTLISTPANMLANETLVKMGLHPFNVFSITPIGLVTTTLGILFIITVGRRFMPTVDIKQSMRELGSHDLHDLYDLDERMFILRLGLFSPLSGVTLGESRLGSALGFNVVAILRQDEKILAPQSDTRLRIGDRLLIIGRLEQLEDFINWQKLTLVTDSISVKTLESDKIEIIEIRLKPQSAFVGLTVDQIDFRKRFGVNVLGILRDGIPRRTHLARFSLQSSDVILIQTGKDQTRSIQDSGEFEIMGPRKPGTYRLVERLLEICIPVESALAGRTLAESRLGETFDLIVVGILRNGEVQPLPDADEILQGGDILIVEGMKEDANVLRGLQELEVDRSVEPDLEWLDSENYELMEVMLHPRANLAGRTLKDLNFREKYGLNVLAIWSGGRAYRSNLFNHVLRFGDALLVYGRREKLNLLGRSRDFLVLSQESLEEPQYDKAGVAAAIMACVLLSAISGWVPISIAAVMGATAMILSGSLSMSEAYQFIEWRAVFLIAGMLPLGIAVQNSGLAMLVTNSLVAAFGSHGPIVLLAGFFLLTALCVQIIPMAVVVVLIAPLAINTALQMGLSPYTFVMTVTIAATTCFMLPVSHAANLLIMGPGGYRTVDYFRSGLPLMLLVMAITLLIVPVFFPF